MALPKQVQAQVAAVEAYEKQVAEAKAAEEPKPQDEPTSQAEAPPEQAMSPSQELVEEPKESAKPADEDPAVWRQRYLSLQGQYNSQVPTLQRQVQQLTDTVSQLTDQLRASQEKPTTQEPDKPLVTKDDEETFGSDLVDLARRIAKEEFGRREHGYAEQIAALEHQLAEAKGQVGQVAQSQAKSASDRFFADLDASVPGWEQIQASQECQQWLASRIPGTSVTWDGALKDAAAQLDVDAVREIFATFFERHPALDPSAKRRPADNRQELARQVAPSRTSAAAPTSTQRRHYTGAEYQAEGNRLVRLMKAGQAEAVLALEAELNAALAEGRVSP